MSDIYFSGAGDLGGATEWIPFAVENSIWEPEKSGDFQVYY